MLSRPQVLPFPALTIWTDYGSSPPLYHLEALLLVRDSISLSQQLVLPLESSAAQSDLPAQKMDVQVEVKSGTALARKNIPSRNVQ
jgi:hypothetical protein